MLNHCTHKWRKTTPVFPGILLREHDWSLLDATGDRITHLFNIGEDDLIDAWLWLEWPNHKMQAVSARSETEARVTCERLLAEFQQAQMMRQ